MGHSSKENSKSCNVPLTDDDDRQWHSDSRLLSLVWGDFCLQAPINFFLYGEENGTKYGLLPRSQQKVGR